MQCGERSGMVTPPIESTAAVPFRWEEEPGKPRPCSALVTFSKPTGTELLPIPPRLLIPSPYVSTTKEAGAGGLKDYLWFGSWRKRAFKLNKREVTWPTHVFPSSTHIPNIKRSGTLWTSICEGLKQVVPWKSKKLKKDGRRADLGSYAAQT